MLQSSHLTDLRSLFGASLLSAVGSLALHLAPFVTVALIADGRASILEAGWVRSTAQVGEFAVTLALPALGFADIGRRAAVLVAMALVCSLFAAGARELPLLLLGWFCIGACSAALKYLGVMAASKAAHLTFAFSLRLSTVLVLAGIASAILSDPNILTSYGNFLLQLSFVFAALLTLGLLLNFRTTSDASTPRPAAATDSGASSRWQALTGLLVVFIFFVGLAGVPVFVLHQAVGRGISLHGAALTVAATKLIAGLWLGISSFISLPKGRQDGLLLQGTLLMLATVTIFVSRDNLELFAGLLVWELSVNTLSARLQSAVVRGNTQFAARWLNLAILLGLAVGPLVNGYAINLGNDHIYAIVGAVTAFAPATWRRLSQLMTDA